MESEFLDGVEQRAAPMVDKPWNEVLTEIQDMSRVFEKANAYRVKYPQSDPYLKMCSLVLAVYRTLLPLFENKQDLLDILNAVFKTTFFTGDMNEYLFKRFGISRDTPGENWDKVCKSFLKGGEKKLDSGWVCEQGIMDHKRCFINIRKYLFADCFLDNGARDIRYLMCVSDYIWGDALEKFRMRFERPTTVAEGSDACRFQLFNVSPHS